jgi:hypothetical protein
MVEAIHAQMTPPGYNYGYDETTNPITLVIDFDNHTKVFVIEGEVTGKGAEQRLKDANGDFDQFNKEQQAQIIMHYFVRRYLLNLPQSDYAPWQTYANIVHS